MNADEFDNYYERMTKRFNTWHTQETRRLRTNIIIAYFAKEGWKAMFEHSDESLNDVYISKEYRNGTVEVWKVEDRYGDFTGGIRITADYYQDDPHISYHYVTHLSPGFTYKQFSKRIAWACNRIGALDSISRKVKSLYACMKSLDETQIEALDEKIINAGYCEMYNLMIPDDVEYIYGLLPTKKVEND